MMECPECHAPAGKEGFEIVEITTDVDRQYGVTRWKLRCSKCGYNHAFIAGAKQEDPVTLYERHIQEWRERAAVFGEWQPEALADGKTWGWWRKLREWFETGVWMR